MNLFYLNFVVFIDTQIWTFVCNIGFAEFRRKGQNPIFIRFYCRRSPLWISDQKPPLVDYSCPEWIRWLYCLLLPKRALFVKCHFRPRSKILPTKFDLRSFFRGEFWCRQDFEVKGFSTKFLRRYTNSSKITTNFSRILLS